MGRPILASNSEAPEAVQGPRRNRAAALRQRAIRTSREPEYVAVSTWDFTLILRRWMNKLKP
jgi:hypothetical protein